MSGHSKWSTIKRQKGAADIKRGQTLEKRFNELIKWGSTEKADDNSGRAQKELKKGLMIDKFSDF